MRPKAGSATLRLSRSGRIRGFQDLTSLNTSYFKIQYFKIQNLKIHDFEKAIFAYDERFNCVKADYYGNWMGWILDYTEEYIYDEQNRVVTLTMTSSGHGDRSEYTYNAEGLLSEELEYEYDGTGWYLSNKYTYEYDTDGQMVLSVGYWYFQYNEEWLPEAKMTWEYEDGLLRSDVYYYYNEGLQDWSFNMRND